VQHQRWALLSPLLDELLDLEGEARRQRLARIEAEDPALAEELRGLIARDESHPEFLAEPLVDVTAFAPQPGQRLGPYRLERLLGEGGMGQVWLALRADGLYERRVALKLLRPGLASAQLRERFDRERQILARLAHPHIARLLDAGLSQDGQPYLALDYVSGEPITAYARRHQLDLNGRLQLFAQVCAAVSHAHANLVVHRDLKPSNILVTSAGDVCLLDFGIGKLLDAPDEERLDITRTGARAFTLHYAAPEQIRNEPVTTMTDVYALGVVLYELLTGNKPYVPARATDAAWEEAILLGDPVRPSTAAQRGLRDEDTPLQRRIARQIAGDLDNILLKAMAKLPERRYPSVEALSEDLRRFQGGQPVQARSQGWLYRMGKYLRRHTLGVGVAATIVSVLVIAMIAMAWQARQALREAERAQAMQSFVVALFENTEDAPKGALDARALLESGLRRIDRELASQPLARAELLGLIARLHAGLGDHAVVLELLDRQQRIVASLEEPPPDALWLEADALRARSELALGRADICVARMSAQLSRITALGDREPLRVAEALRRLAHCHRALGGFEVAQDLFGRASSLRETAGAPVPLRAESRADVGALHADRREIEPAIEAYQEALGLLRSNGGDRNALGVQIWTQLGRLQRQAGRPRDAESALRQAYDIGIERHGPDHPDTLEVMREMGELMLAQGRLADAVQWRQRQAASAARLEPGQRAQLQQQVAQLEFERDQLPAAEAATAEALRWYERAAPDGGLAALHCLRAQIALAAGDPARAAQAAQRCRRTPTDPLTWARAEWLQARIAFARGDAAAAERALRVAEGLLDGAGDNPELREEIRFLRLRLLAEQDLAAGQRAIADWSQALAAPRQQRLRWRAQAALAGLECRQPGAGEAGTGRLLQTWQELQRALPEHRRLQRELQQLAAACGLAMDVPASAEGVAEPLSPDPATTAAEAAGPR
jgi:serine/threonine-protein kinase